MQITVGNTIDDRYQIVRPIASGGFATVFQAYHKQFDRMVAVKVLDQYALTEPDSLPRFEREAKAVSGLRHKNIVGVYGFGLWRESPYMVLEYVDGVSLHQLLQKHGTLQPRRSAEICAQVCEALEAAHKHGIIHRDLKPSNIMISTAADGSDLVKIIDFGLAKLMPGFGLSAQKLTETGAALGTCLYMPPEQCTGFDIDQRADIYSTGCILWEVLKGAPPFVADTNVSVMYMHLNSQHVSIDDTNGKDPTLRRLDAIVNKAMAKNREERYASAAEMLADLNAFLAGNEPGFAQHAPQPVKATPARILPTKQLLVACSVLITAFCVALGAPHFKPTSPATLEQTPSSLELYKIAFNNSRPWEPQMGNRSIVALNAVTQNKKDNRLDTRKLYDLYAILASEEAQACNWKRADEYNRIATALLRRYSATDPLISVRELMRADCVYQLGNREEGIALTKRLISSPPPGTGRAGVGHAYLQLAGYARQVGNLDESAALLKRACAPTGDGQLMRCGRMHLGNIYTLMGRPVDAQRIIHEGLTWPGTPHNNGELTEAMVRCLVAQRQYPQAHKISANMQKFNFTMPHEFNFRVLQIADAVGMRDKVRAEHEVEILCQTKSPSFDLKDLNKLDTDTCKALLVEAGYDDLLTKLEHRFPSWFKVAS